MVIRTWQPALKYIAHSPDDRSLNIWRKHLTRLLTKLNLLNLTTLDIGCDSGYFSFLMSELGAKEVVGLDVDSKRIQAARQNARIRGNTNRVEFVAADIESFRTKKQFDLALLSEVLEHLVNPMAALGRVREALRTGGIIIISVPNPLSIVSHLSGFVVTEVLRQYKYDLDAHKSEMPLQELIALVRAAGFNIVSAYYYGLSLLNRFDDSRAIRRLCHSVANHRVSGPYLGTNSLVIARKR